MNFTKDLSQAHDFLYDPVTSLHRTNQHQQVEGQFSHIGPDGGHHRYAGIHSGRAGGHGGEDDAGKSNDYALQTDSGVTAQEVLAHIGRGFSGKGRKRNGRNGRIHPKGKHPAIHGQDHHEG